MIINRRLQLILNSDAVQAALNFLLGDSDQLLSCCCSALNYAALPQLWVQVRLTRSITFGSVFEVSLCDADKLSSSFCSRKWNRKLLGLSRNYLYTCIYTYTQIHSIYSINFIHLCTCVILPSEEHDTHTSYYCVSALFSRCCANVTLFDRRLDRHPAQVLPSHRVPFTSPACPSSQSALTCTSCYKVRMNWSTRWHCKTWVMFWKDW